MILQQLLEIIRADKVTGAIPLIPNGLGIIEEAILYEFTPQTNDKIIRQDSLKLKVNAFDYVRALELAERLRYLLITFADQNLTNDIMSCVMSGGGELYNKETHLHTHIIMYQLKSKARGNL